MKKLLILVFFCAALFYTASAEDSERNYIYKNDFSDLTEYTDENGNLKSNEYFSAAGLIASVSESLGDEIKIYNDGSEHNDALYISVEGRTSGIGNLKIPKSYTLSDDLLILEFDIKAVGNNGFTAYSFPGFNGGSNGWLQGWVGVTKNETNKTVDYRYLDTSIGGNNWAGPGQIINYGENAKWVHLKFTVDISSKTYSLDIAPENGSIYSYSGLVMRANNTETVTDISFDFREGTIVFDNFELYTLDKMFIKSATVTDGAVNVPVNEEQRFVFSNSVDTATLNNITISGLSEEDYDLSVENGNTVVIKYLKNLAFSKEYKIDFSGISATNSVSAIGAAVSFTTEGAGEVYIKDCKVFENFGENSTESPLTANGSFQYVKALVENTSSESKKVTFLLAFYDEYNYLCDMVYTQATVTANSETYIGAGTVIPQEYGGGKVKIFLWDSMETMVPYTLNIENDLN